MPTASGRLRSEWSWRPPRPANSAIVGRGSGYYLRDRPDVFHVFIYARLEEKVRRLREIGKSEEEAVEVAEPVDRDRSAYIKQYFGVEWLPRYFYHLMINSTLGDEGVVQTILNSMALFEKQPA